MATHNFIAYIQNRADSENPFEIKKELITITQEEIDEIMEVTGNTEEVIVSEFLSDIHAEYGQGFMNAVFEKI